ncbi:MAG: YncE family protein [Fimbriimonadaceae bacterium]
MFRSSLFIASGFAVAAAIACARPALPPSSHGVQADAPTGPYSVLRTAKVGGDGGFDYVYADPVGRKLYIARSGPTPRLTVFNLDTLDPAGEIAERGAHGAAADAKYHHAFASSNPVAMWDTKTLTLIKTIAVSGRPDGILNDEFNHRTYVFSHSAPNATVLDDNDGAVLGTIDLGGAPEQAASDGKGHLYVDLEDKDSVAVVDAQTMKVTATYGLNGKGGGCAGLGLDAKHHILFVACRNPQNMVMLDATNGKYLADLPIGRGCDGAGFNPRTGEAFSSQGDGTLTIIKEDSPTTFEVEQTVKTMPGAKTMTIDTKTNKVFLIAAEFGPVSASTTPGRRFRRGPMKPGSFSIVVVGKSSR